MNTARCRRCGIARMVKPERGIPELCIDCIGVVNDITDLCGTMEGHWLHVKAGDMVCARCNEARRQQDAATRRRKGIKPRKPAECGTDSGYARHRRHGQDACDPCKAAHSRANPSRRARPQQEEDEAA